MSTVDIRIVKKEPDIRVIKKIVGNNTTIDNNTIVDNTIEEKSLAITTKDIEEQISTYSYHGVGKPKIKEVENARLPVMVKAFYKLVYEYNRIPTEIEFLKEYFKDENFTKNEGKGWINYIDNKGKERPVRKYGVICRALRSYPSIIRDFHFTLKLIECEEFSHVVYDTGIDYEGGIDIRVAKDGIAYGLALMVGTQRSYEYDRLKEDRHGFRGKLLKMYLSEKNKVEFGNFNLYSDIHVQEVLDEIEESKESKNETN